MSFDNGHELLGTNSTLNVQPPSGESWFITGVAHSSFGWTGAGEEDTPELDVGLQNGVNATARIMREENYHSFGTVLQLPVSNGCYLEITNTDTSQRHVGYSARIGTTTTGVAEAESDVDLIASSGTYTITPPAGEVWVFRRWGSFQWTGTVPNQSPDISVGMSDGTDTVDLTIQDKPSLYGLIMGEGPHIVLDENWSLKLVNHYAGNNATGYGAMRFS